MIQVTRTEPKDESNEHAKKENSPRNLQSDDADDSLVDFKSPESKKLRSAKLPKVARPTAKPRKKVESNLKIRFNNQKEKRKKEVSQNKKSINKSQPSIESTFFKSRDSMVEGNASDDIKAGVVCPLCFKVYKDEESQALHVKICAIKYKLSTKQLLDVVELQKRQEEERRSLGLLAGPALQEKKKQTLRRTTRIPTEDADLQLGLALSKSLQEIEEINEFNDLDLQRETLALGNWKEKEPKIIPQLEKFGFESTGKVTAPTRTRKRKLNEVTVLQTRSEADRNRILTERITEILMGSDALTQELEQGTGNQGVKEELMLRRSLLKTFHCTETHLWQASTLLAQQAQFYVSELSNYIAPSEESLANNGDVEIITDSSSSMQQSEELATMERAGTFGDQKRFYEMSLTTERASTDEVEEEKMNDQFGNNLALDWGRALNDSSASDMIINVSNGKRIWAHKLVLYVRCPNMLLDVTTNEDSSVSAIKEKIDWPGLYYDIALAFLEFIYCGRIQKYKNVIKDDGLSKLRSLARKYRVQQLFDYLRKCEQSNIPINSQSDNYYAEENARNVTNAPKPPEINLKLMREDEPVVPPVVIESELELSLPQTPKNIIPSVKEDSGDFTKVRNIEGTPSNNTSCLHEEMTPVNIGMSPDMFDETDEAVSIFAGNSTSNEPLRKTKASDLKENTLTLRTVSSISIDSTPKIPCDSPERLVEEKAEKSILSTPNSSHPDRSKQSHSTLKKQRSNLSLFIEKFQKENNRSDSDMESDTSIIQNTEMRRNRNPFNVRQFDDSPIHSNLQHDDLIQSAPIKKSGLDALDDNCSDTSTEPYEPDSPSSLKNEEAAEQLSSDDEMLAQLELDLSLCTQKYSGEQDKVDDKGDGEQDTNNFPRVTSVANATVDNVVLSECETDEEETSMYTKYKKTHLHNSIADYRSLLRKKVSSLDFTHLETEAIDRSENSIAGLSISETRSVRNEIEMTALSDSETKTSHVSLLSRERESPTPLKRKRISRKRSDLSEKKYQHSVSGSDTDILCSDSPTRSETNNSRGIPEYHSTDGHMELSVDNDDMNRASGVFLSENGQKLCEGHVTPVNEACIEDHGDKEIDNETVRGGLLCPRISTTRTLESPVWVLSSPEISLNTTDHKVDANDKAKSSQSDDDIDRIFEHEIYLANVRVDDDVISEPPSPLNKFKSDGLIQYSSINLHSSLETALSNHEKSKANFNSSASQAKDALALERLSVRKLQRKSVSHGNFTVNAKSHSTPNLNRCKCYREDLSRVSSKSTRTELSTTPPPDYQLMDTPKLHKELKKYGLKLQKRKRAVKLLTHIYNELHPIVPAGGENIELRTMCLESDDDGQLAEASHDSSNRSNEAILSQDYSIADMPASDIVIAEERHLDEIEPLTTEIGSIVKDRFRNLLKTNRELYNKILSYEPLCLEELHSLLKANGLKCNKNTLMDFLDEQCITFYVQENNRRDRARGGSNEKKRKNTNK